jgi:hypothetical protein
MALSDKVRNDWVQQLKRSRNARIGGKARRKQVGVGDHLPIFTKKKEPSAS